MWTQRIGEDAGKVWRLLREPGEMNLAGLKQRAGFTDQELCLALGWLAREGKVKFFKVRNQVMVALV
jgi:hypothetical protein